MEKLPFLLKGIWEFRLFNKPAATLRSVVEY